MESLEMSHRGEDGTDQSSTLTAVNRLEVDQPSKDSLGQTLASTTHEVLKTFDVLEGIVLESNASIAIEGGEVDELDEGRSSQARAITTVKLFERGHPFDVMVLHPAL